ncbi:phage/plasmid primase, P4 family [Ileibacterium valens]|uniref:phage/plasmid primase, P4 family n=1 Tax=Ileibacterium valens TaxID=1862668 RepID=UPI0023525C66|nr:phage/plasmid primase, P4 family [Ileibacterium valens]
MESLKKQKIWICWNLIDDTKRPIAASGCKTSAKSNKHSCTYVSYDEAVAAKNRNGYSGVGFVIPKGYFFLDLDHRDLEDPLVKKILSRFDSYAELSQSGNGIHIYGKCDLSQIPQNHDKLSNRFYVKNSKLGMEVYIGGLTNRYAAFTGNQINTKPVAESTWPLLVTLRHEMLRPRPEKMVEEIDVEDTLFDIVTSMRKQKNGEKFKSLYDDGLFDKSHSEADLSLCCMLAWRIGNNPDLIDKAFRGSALYRPKWEREDYRRTTIEKAIELQHGSFYDPTHGRPDFIFVEKDKEKVSAVLLAKELSKRFQYILVKGSSKEAIQKFVYQNGCYRLYSDDMFKALLKGIIEEYNPMLINSNVINEAFKLLMMETEFTSHEQLDGDRDYINFQNGLLYLPTMELEEHTPEVYSTIQIPCDWTGKPVETPVFDRYMNDLFPDDADSRNLLLQFAGVALSNIPGYFMKKALFLVGDGDTGKSQIKGFIESILGKQYCCSLELDDLEKRFATSQLYGKRICGSTDMKFTGVPELNVFKKATGGDLLGAEFKGEATFEFIYKGILWYCGNRLPRFGGDDGAWVYERFVALQCRNVIPKEKQDPNLMQKLLSEKEGVVYEAVMALKKVIQNGYRYDIPESLEAIKESFREENNSVFGFLAECVVPVDGVSKVLDWCTVKRMYGAYCQWCKENGRRSKSSPEFKKTVGTHYSLATIRRSKGLIYQHFRLNEEAETDYRPQLDPDFSAQNDFDDHSFLDDDDLPF